MDISLTSIHAAPGTTSANPEPGAAPAAEQRRLASAVRKLNASEVFGSDNELTFSIDRASHKLVVRVINRKTHELVRQIPAEYVLRMAEENNGR
jgi:uncharacterized FlaG/YvyC family protein